MGQSPRVPNAISAGRPAGRRAAPRAGQRKASPSTSSAASLAACAVACDAALSASSSRTKVCWCGRSTCTMHAVVGARSRAPPARWASSRARSSPTTRAAQALPVRVGRGKSCGRYYATNKEVAFANELLEQEEHADAARARALTSICPDCRQAPARCESRRQEKRHEARITSQINASTQPLTRCGRLHSPASERSPVSRRSASASCKLRHSYI